MWQRHHLKGGPDSQLAFTTRCQSNFSMNFSMEKTWQVRAMSNWMVHVQQPVLGIDRRFSPCPTGKTCRYGVASAQPCWSGRWM